MKPNQLNPAQLMMGYLSNENGKIGQKIVNSEFSRELDAQNAGLTETCCLGLNLSEGGLAADGSYPFPTLTQTPQNQASPAGTMVDEQRVRALQRLSPQKKPVQVAQEKVRQDLVFTDTALVQKVLAQFQIPAEVRQKIKGAEDDQGRISLKTLEAILNQSRQNPAAQDIIPGQSQAEAQDVQQLLSSIRQTNPDPTHQLPQFDARSGGAYTFEEFKSTLDAVIQQITRERGRARQVLAGSPQSNASSSSSAQDTPISSTAVSPGQVQRITSNLMPSFSDKASLKGDASKLASIFDASGAKGNADQRIGEITDVDAEPEASMQLNAVDLAGSEKIAQQYGSQRMPVPSFNEMAPLKGNESASGLNMPGAKVNILQQAAHVTEVDAEPEAYVQLKAADLTGSEKIAQQYGSPRMSVPSFNEMAPLKGNESASGLNVTGAKVNILQQAAHVTEVDAEPEAYVQHGSQRMSMPSFTEKAPLKGNESASGLNVPGAKVNILQQTAHVTEVDAEPEAYVQHGSQRMSMPFFTEKAPLKGNESASGLNVTGAKVNILQQTAHVTEVDAEPEAYVQLKAADLAGSEKIAQQYGSQRMSMPSFTEKAPLKGNESASGLNVSGAKVNVLQQAAHVTEVDGKLEAAVQFNAADQAGSQKITQSVNPKMSMPSFTEKTPLKGNESKAASSLNTTTAKTNVPKPITGASDAGDPAYSSMQSKTPSHTGSEKTSLTGNEGKTTIKLDTTGAKGNSSQRIAGLAGTDSLADAPLQSQTPDQAGSERIAQLGNLDSSLLSEAGEETMIRNSIKSGGSSEAHGGSLGADTSTHSDAPGIAPPSTPGDPSSQSSQDGKEMREQGFANLQSNDKAPQVNGDRVGSDSFRAISSATQSTNAGQSGSQAASSPTLSLDSPRWPAELSQKLHELQQQNRNQLTLELEPKSLGKMTLRIETDHNQVTAWVSTENDHVKTLLTQNSPILRQHLEDQGLTLGQLFVDVRQEKGSQYPQQQNRSSRRQGKSLSSIAGADTGEAKAGSSRTVYRQGSEEQIINFFA